MSTSDNPKITKISKARSLEKVAHVWDTHSLADYWEQTHDVEFEVRANRRGQVTLSQSEHDKSQAQTLNSDKL